MHVIDTSEASRSAIAVVSTSLHLLYLAELTHNLKIDYLELIVFLKRPTDKPQIMQMLKEVRYQKLHFLEATSKMANYFVSLYEILKLKGLDLTRERYEFGIFADYGRSLLANVHCGSYYWLGDGTKIIFETSVAGQSSLNRHNLQRYADPLLRVLTGKRLCLPIEPMIFSPFQLDGQKQEVNRFDWLRLRYGAANTNRSITGRVYFFGTYFSERGGRVLMSDEHYLLYMAQVVDYYQIRGVNLVYVPHRHESDTKLEAIAGLTNVEVQRFLYPAELEFFKRGEHPVHLASFFSTCLFHFKALALSETITSFYLDFSRHNRSYQPVAEEIYRSLEKTLGARSVAKLEAVN